MSAQSYTGHTHQPCKGSRVLQTRRAETTQELEDGEECCEMLSCEYGMTTALVNAQELWLPTQNQTSQHSSTHWGGAHELHPS